MYWRNVLTGRLSHWNMTEDQVCEELLKRIAMLEDRKFASWLAAFVSATAIFLKAIFIERTFDWSEVADRLKSLSKESFLSLHSVFICHHLAICRDQVDDLFAVTIDLAKVLRTTPGAVNDQIAAYDGLSEWQMATHLNRQVSRVLGIVEANPVNVLTWGKAVIMVARTANECAEKSRPILDKMRMREMQE